MLTCHTVRSLKEVIDAMRVSSQGAFLSRTHENWVAGWILLKELTRDGRQTIAEIARGKRV